MVLEIKIKEKEKRLQSLNSVYRDKFLNLVPLSKGEPKHYTTLEEMVKLQDEIDETEAELLKLYEKRSIKIRKNKAQSCFAFRKSAN